MSPEKTEKARDEYQTFILTRSDACKFSPIPILATSITFKRRILVYA